MPFFFLFNKGPKQFNEGEMIFLTNSAGPGEYPLKKGKRSGEERRGRKRKSKSRRVGRSQGRKEEREGRKENLT